MACKLREEHISTLDFLKSIDTSLKRLYASHPKEHVFPEPDDWTPKAGRYFVSIIRAEYFGESWDNTWNDKLWCVCPIEWIEKYDITTKTGAEYLWMATCCDEENITKRILMNAQTRRTQDHNIVRKRLADIKEIDEDLMYCLCEIAYKENINLPKFSKTVRKGLGLKVQR